MIWILFALFACGLVAFLLTSLRRYERESAAAAREQIEALQAELAQVVERVQTLEAIAAADPAEPKLDARVRFDEEAPPAATSAPASVSSATSTPPRQRSR